MKQVILHIGPHKTGTTFLQKIFSQNKETLATNGIDYIDFGMVHFGHHKIPEFLNKKKFKKGEIKKAISQSPHERVLISSENFDLLRPYSIDFLKNELIDFKVEIVIFYRMPTDRMFSWWQEEVKHGGTDSYYDYIVDHYSKPFLSPVLNTSKLVDLYIEYFGSDSIRLFDYDYCIQEKGVLKEFQKYLDLSSDLKVESKKINQRLAIQDIEIIRVLNLIAKKHGTLHAHNIRDAYLSKWDKNDPIMKTLESVQFKQVKNITIGDTFIDRILKNNFVRQYEANFFTKTSSSYTETSIPVPHSDWAIDDEVLALINNIYLKILN